MVTVTSISPGVRLLAPAALLLLPLSLVSCGGDQASEKSGGLSGDARTGAASSEEKAAARINVRTASLPDDPCAWVPVAEVESAVGALAGPPTREDGCLYTLALPEAVSARRQQAIAKREQLNEKLKAAFKDYQPPQFSGPIANYERDPATYAMTLVVDVSGSVAGELGMAAAGRVMESWLPPQSRSGGEPIDRPEEPGGWDVAQRIPYGFIGRLGHISITVQGKAPDVPIEQMQALAGLVRDRIPDLPFPATNPYQVIDLGAGGRDPCSLLSRADAEAILGTLVVDPYRSSSYFPPLAHPEGYSCAYYTKGHRVFVLSPTWADGSESFGIAKGIGGLVSQVLPEELTVIKGPWDRAHINNTTGSLLFLKGDRLLEVTYATSSTDRKGAIRLAAKAIERLAS